MRFAIIYIILGILFTMMAFRSAEETIWNFTTILLVVIATLDFGMGYRYLKLHFEQRKKK